MPLAVRRLAGAGPDHVRDQLAARRAADAEVAVLEVIAQSALFDFRARKVIGAEAAGAVLRCRDRFCSMHLRPLGLARYPPTPRKLSSTILSRFDPSTIRPVCRQQ